jgi:hypothetical protein
MNGKRLAMRLICYTKNSRPSWRLILLPRWFYSKKPWNMWMLSTYATFNKIHPHKPGFPVGSHGQLLEQ